MDRYGGVWVGVGGVWVEMCIGMGVVCDYVRVCVYMCMYVWEGMFLYGMYFKT